MVERDAAGQVVALRPETEWDPTEREWAQALTWYRDQVLCPCGCGFDRQVAWDPGTEFARHVPPPTRCHVRTGITLAQQQWADDHPGDKTGAALLWGARVTAGQ